MTQLMKLEQARQLLAECKTVADAKEVRDKAEALRVYFKQQEYGLEAQNHAFDIKSQAERKCGELLAKMELKAGRPTNGNTMLPLSDLGISKMQSHRWQKIAAIPEQEYAAFLNNANAQRLEATTNGLLRRWSEISKPKNGKKAKAKTAELLNKLHAAIKKLYADWPKHSRSLLAAKLRDYAEELDEKGELTL